MFEREGGSAEHTAVVAEFRLYDPKCAMLPRTNQVRHFVSENRNQEWVVLSQSAAQNQSLRIKQSDDRGTATSEVLAEYSNCLTRCLLTSICGLNYLFPRCIRVTGIAHQCGRIHVRFQTPSHTAGAEHTVEHERNMSYLIGEVVSAAI